jgi:hypothetical protein
MIAGLVVTGCCSTQTDIQHSSTSDLQLRRYDLKHCLSTERLAWGSHSSQTDDYSEVAADHEEKAAIEQEITRRDVTNYHWSPSVPNQYTHDRCHCQCWVVDL